MSSFKAHTTLCLGLTYAVGALATVTLYLYVVVKTRPYWKVCGCSGHPFMD